MTPFDQNNTKPAASEGRPLIFLSAGEPSGDIHAAELVRELKKRYPNARFVAYGGPEMKKAGCETPVLLTELAVMWFGRTLWNLPTFIGYLKNASRFFETEKPDLVILVDFPGFNWHIARRAKQAGIPVCYFMPPQIWGWAQWRVKKMRRFVDFCLCTLPFEEKWLHSHGVTASNIGHPFFAEVREKRLDTEFIDTLSVDESHPILLILPGSRNQEVTLNFADMADAVSLVCRQVPNVRPMVGAFKEIQAEKIRKMLASRGINWPVYVGRTAELMTACTVSIAVSGSVSMELLARKKPSVIYYRLSRLAHRVMRFFRRVKYITLVNLLAGDRTAGHSIYYPESVKYIPKEPAPEEREIMLFPEFLTDRNRADDAAKPLIDWLLHPEKRQKREAELAELLRLEDDQSRCVERASHIIAEKLESRTTPNNN